MMKVIDKESRIPLYYQLMEIIIDEIESGKLRENDQIPSERELCEKYDISRATVRQAIQELEKEGYLYKQHGKGTFVSPKEFKQDLLHFYSFTEEMKKLGKTPTSRVIKFEVIESDAKIAKKMNISIGDIVYKFIRLRLADQQPMMLETTYLPYQRFPNVKQSDLEQKALYDILTERFNVSFIKAEESFQSVNTRKHEAQLLEYEENRPSMMIERTTFDKIGIIEYTVGIARGDRFKYRVVLNI
ncbi:GntR family transcriptional regulator [Tepidibacillus fermentans]|uniref:GntR family transcriptional regulator n=1 Tax=Tepidibacillus fermentans TaxID=1281767 RepID=A0A4R3KEX6_9BACI|nr:GntR family transcriptional regulator [Tepidibacillus fermentans]TCS81827.1 GntR family transcriptional regulator [Tepidibacillus fermentans]